jgi:Type IV secretion system pilin
MRKLIYYAAGLFLAIFIAVALIQPGISAQEVTEEIQNGLCAGANFEFSDSSNACDNDNNALERVSGIIRRIVNLLSIVVGVVAVIMIIIGGFRYVTSGGSDASVTGAKNTILYAVIGLIIVALSQLLVNFVLSNLAGV